MSAIEKQPEPMLGETLCFAALEALGRAVLVTDRHGIILYVNRSFTDITGFSAAEVMGKTPAVLRSGKQAPEFYQQMWRAIAQDGEWEGTLWNRRKDGNIYHERLNIRRMAMAGGETHYVAVFSDISEQDALQRALIDAQKRELMAALTGGVAHNFNNYLAAIQGFAYLGKRQAKEAKSGTYFSEILATTETASALIREMLQISHAEPPQDQVLDLVPTMKQLVRTAQTLLPGHIRLDATVQEDQPCMVLGNQSDIEQAILNLVTNARDALEGTPDAQIQIDMREEIVRAGTCPENCPRISACPMIENRHVALRVADNGNGIPESIRDHVFDPFFTTKGSMGTGLGLASTHQIIHRLDGAIWLDREHPSGTCFRICLPMLDGGELAAYAN